MIRRVRTLALLAAVVSAAVATSVAGAQLASRAGGGPTGSYWVAISLPDRDATAAVLVLDESAGALRGMLVIEGSPAAALDRISVSGDELQADVSTSAGPAHLTVRLRERTGEGTLVLLAKSARR